MKIRVERDSFQKALTPAARSTETRGSLPILTGVRITADTTVTITGTNLETTIETSVPANVTDPGTIVVPAKVLTDLVSKAPNGALELATNSEGSELTLSAGRFSAQIRLLPADEFPALTFPAGDSVTVPANAFLAALKQVHHAASRDNARPILCGIYFEKSDDGLRLVATDSYRLGWTDLTDTNLTDTALIPQEAIGELIRLKNIGDHVSINADNLSAMFTTGDTRIMTRLIAGDFPNYRGLIPAEQPRKLTARRTDLIEAIGRVRLMAREMNTPVRFNVDGDGNVTLEAMTLDVGTAQEAIDCTWTGEEGPFSVAFNPEYLSQALDSVRSDEIELNITDAQKPAVINGTSDNPFRCLLMPVRIS